TWPASQQPAAGARRELTPGARGAREPFTGAGVGGELTVVEEEVAAAQDELRPALDLPAVVDRVAGQRLHVSAVDRPAVRRIPQRDVRVRAGGDRAFARVEAEDAGG